MIQFLGNRGASAVTGFFMLALASSEAIAAPAATTAALKSAPLVQAAAANSSAYQTALATNAAAKPAAAATAAVATAAVALNGTVRQSAPAQSVTLKLAPQVAQEAAWLHSHGWGLDALVQRYRTGAELDEQANCVAIAVYHEARGESLEGQLAVARVIMNRAASGKYPATWCGTVKQPWQFSFVNPRTGAIPYVDQSSASWEKAVAITRLAVSNAVPSLDGDVLWYHATYVAPSWGKRLSRVEKIGTHIFYRA